MTHHSIFNILVFGVELTMSKHNQAAILDGLSTSHGTMRTVVDHRLVQNLLDTNSATTRERHARQHQIKSQTQKKSDMRILTQTVN